MGCVTMTQTFFGTGEITEQRMNSAILRGALEIRAVRENYQPTTWDVAIGSSGTIKAILKVMNGIGCDGEVITDSCLKKLRKRMIKSGSIDALDFEGLSDERRPVFAGGVAVLSSLFNSLGIKELHVSNFALREGLLYELIGEISRTDVRETTIESLQQRFSVDIAQAKQVTNLAMRLFSQIASDWKLDERQDAKLLRWAAATHEIGLSLSHNSFHKHSAYILSNADLPGFTNQQKQQLSTIVRFQRRKISSTAIKELPKYHRDSTKKLILLLRLAIILHRSRTPDTKIEVDITKIDHDNFSLTVPENWLSQHPLNEAELNSEIAAWEKLNFTLSIS
jgi:exopolyphosphatase/guanosine-5'-triphosphate,3'-diphosphate pyrophosphatase